MWRPTIKVKCIDCDTYFDEEKVEFVDIEEDIQGYDILTFTCPKCGKIKKSKRLS
jgi:RNase P subunit RPR2